MILPKA